MARIPSIAELASLAIHDHFIADLAKQLSMHEITEHIPFQDPRVQDAIVAFFVRTLNTASIPDILQDSETRKMFVEVMTKNPTFMDAVNRTITERMEKNLGAFIEKVFYDKELLITHIRYAVAEKLGEMIVAGMREAEAAEANKINHD